MNRHTKNKIVFLSSIACIILCYYAIDSIFFKQAREYERAKLKAQKITNTVISHLYKMALSIETIGGDVSYVLETAPYTKDDLTDLLKAIVSYNQDVHGALIVFKPGYTLQQNASSQPDSSIQGDSSIQADSSIKPDSNTFAQYYYKHNGGVEYYNLWSTTDQYMYHYYYIIPKISGQPLWLEPEYAGKNHEYIIARYSVPIFSYGTGGKKEFKGIFAMDINLDWFVHYIKSVDDIQVGNFFLISRFGTYMYHPNPDVVMNESIFSVADEYNSRKLREIGRKMIKGDTGFIKFTDIFDKNNKWLYYAPIPDTKWSIGMFFPEKEIFENN